MSKGEFKKRLEIFYADSIDDGDDIEKVNVVLDEAKKEFPHTRYDDDADREIYQEEDIEEWFKRWFGDK
jgi:hypothetical protein